MVILTSLIIPDLYCRKQIQNTVTVYPLCCTITYCAYLKLWAFFFFFDSVCFVWEFFSSTSFLVLQSGNAMAMCLHASRRSSQSINQHIPWNLMLVSCHLCPTAKSNTNMAVITSYKVLKIMQSVWVFT